MAAESLPKRCGVNGNAQPGATKCDVNMTLSCRGLKDGTCPRAGQFPITKTVSMAFPPTTTTTLRLLIGNIEAEKDQCPDK